ELLDGVQGLPPAADEGPQLLPLQDDLVPALLRLVHLHLGGAAHVLEQPLQEGPNLPGLLVVAGLPQVLGLDRLGLDGLSLLRLGGLLLAAFLVLPAALGAAPAPALLGDRLLLPGLFRLLLRPGFAPALRLGLGGGGALLRGGLRRG